jgi:hypothetical protein
MSSVYRYASALGVPLLLLACAHPSPGPTLPAFADLCLPTTLPPPDSIPIVVRRGIEDSARLVTENSRVGGPWPRGVLFITFRVDIPLAARDSLLRAVPACVVGGSRIGRDGTYLIALLNDTTADATVQAMFRLQAAPPVSAASVVVLFGP